ncbi:MAX gene-associated protein-like [Conger conger]|uniref:MAX gene-associated protein-like n=1 Tax=Conger conger TaxID=82655 RepID=UPI002A5A3619|nr:MAX gene-associated protein-like [Conger conger]XP_061099795.1 MAX gene-associated protein-like [Conger conger]
MTSVESLAVMVDEEEEEMEEEAASAGVPSGTLSPSTTPPPGLFFLMPEQVSQCGQDQDILLTNQDCDLADPGTPAVSVQDLPPMTAMGSIAEATSLPEDLSAMTPKGPAAEPTSPPEDLPPMTSMGSTAEATSLPEDLSATSTCKGVTVTLRNSHMWNEFHGCRTEMILTKEGRRMFPYCSFSISGLTPLKQYALAMDITPMDNSRWKWNGDGWEASGNAEPHVKGRVFIHPDSPSLGHCWTQSSVSFYKLKLTNNTNDDGGNIILHSMHRYLPQLHLVPVETATSVIQLSGPDVMTFTFPQAEFFAVTTYQNFRITQLKIRCNPFAKDFREEGPFSQLSKPRVESFEPPLCYSIELNGTNSIKTKFRDLQKTMRSLFRPGKDVDKDVEQEAQHAVGCGAEFLNGVQSILEMDSAIRGEKRPNPLACSDEESKLKVRRVDPERRNGVYAEKEMGLVVDDVSLEPQLKDQSCIAGEGNLAMQGDDHMMAVRPAPEWTSALKVHASMSSECEESCRTLALSLTPQNKTAKPMAISSEPSTTFPLSLSPSQKSSPDSHISLYPFSQSPAGPVLTPVSKPSSSAGSDKGVNLHGQATPAKEANDEASTPCYSPSGNTQPTSTSTWKRKRRSKRRRCKKYMKKSSMSAQNVAEQPTETAMLPDLEDVEGMLFVSFVSKEALGAHLGDLQHSRGEQVPLQEKTDPPKRIEVAGSVEEKITRLQDVLLLGMPRLEHRQVIHSVLQDEGAPFLSRTGKTKDFKKIKGWREKFVTSEVPSLKLPAAGADAGVDPGNRSAFCSDLLDEYLEREGRLMDKPAAESPSPGSPPLVLYQLPVKSSSYIRPLHTVLGKQAPRPPLKHLPACSKPKPKHTFRPASVKTSVGCRTKRRLSTSDGAKAAGSQTAAEKAPRPSAPKPCPQEARVKADYSAARLALAKVMLKLMDLEDRAVGQGETRTAVTSERAELAMAALLTAEGTLKRSRGQVKSLPRWAPHCKRAFCRLGCVCASLARERRVTTHCRKPACMFGCSCLKHKMVLIKPSLTSSPKPEQGALIGQKRPGEVFPSNSMLKQEVLVDQETPGKGFPLNSMIKQEVLVDQKTPGEGFVSNSEPEQASLIGQKTPREVFPLNSMFKQEVLVDQETPGEGFASNSEPEQASLIGQKIPGEVFPLHSMFKQEVLVDQETPGEGFASNSEPEQGAFIKEEMTDVEFPSACLPEQGDVDAFETIGEDSTSYHKKKKKKKKKKKRKRKRERLSYAILEGEFEMDLEVEPAAHLDRLWNRKAGEVDPEPLYIPPPVCLDTVRPSASSPTFKSAAFRTYVPRPNPVVRDEDKDPVYLYFESMMTCARVREYMSKPPERPCYCKSVLCSRQVGDPYHYFSYPTEEKKQSKVQAKVLKPPKEPRRTLEVLSECDWETERDAILAAVCRRAGRGHLSQPFRVGPFLVRPFGPTLRKEGDTCSVAHKVLITHPLDPSPESAAEKSPPDRPEPPKQSRAVKGSPFWSDILPAGLLTAKKKQPGLPAKGLIEVNGKSYSQAKVQLGQMGALHMTSRLAAYLTGRWQPENQKRSMKAPPAKSVGRGCSDSFTPPPARSSGTTSPGFTMATSTSRPVLKPPECPPAPMLLVPVEDRESAASASLVPIAPGESVVLHPVPGSSGTPLFRHPSGRLVHLVPLNQLKPVPPNILPCRPGGVSHLPQPLAAGHESAFAGTGATSPVSTTPLPPPNPTETTAAIPAAPKPAPSFLGQHGTHTIRIGPSIASRTRSKGPAPTGFTPLQPPPGTLPQVLQREAKLPGEGPRSPLSGTPQGPDPEPQAPAQMDGGGPGRSDTHPPSSPETHRLCAGMPIRRLAVKLHRVSAEMAGSGVSERRAPLVDASEASVGKMNDSVNESEVQQGDDVVDVETVEELPEENSLTQTTAGVAQKKLTKDRLIRQADCQAELDKNRQTRKSEFNTDREYHTDSERRRRNQLNDLFSHLQDTLGIQSSSKISRGYVLNRAMEEIQTLVDQGYHLEQEKRRLTQKRAAYIEEITLTIGSVTPEHESASPTETPGSVHTPKCVLLKWSTDSEPAEGAQTSGGVSERRVPFEDVPVDSEDDSVSEASYVEVEAQQGAEAVDVEAVTTWTTAGADQLTKVGLTPQADSQAERETNAQTLQDTEISAVRHRCSSSARRRRNQLNNRFTRLQEVVGLRSASKVTKGHVLNRAVEEIQTLEDQGYHLEHKKRELTQKRAAYIEKIAQRSGKAEELIILKLQDICSKQKSLEAKKQKAQQRAPGPDRKQSPPTPASELDNFITMPKIVSVRSLATSPLLTAVWREQGEQAASEATPTAVSPLASQNVDVPGDYPATPSSLQKEGACSWEETPISGAVPGNKHLSKVSWLS